MAKFTLNQSTLELEQRQVIIKDLNLLKNFIMKRAGVFVPFFGREQTVEFAAALMVAINYVEGTLHVLPEDIIQP